MAKMRIELFLNSLQRHTYFELALPNDAPNENGRPLTTIFHLHGYTGKAENWVSEELMKKYNIAVVSPTAENSFYLDGRSAGHAYATMVGEELVDYVRRTFGIAQKPENTYIMGISMGGFGAVRTALAYPHVFGKVAGLSSALIVHDIAHMKEGESNPMANYAYYSECFGDLETVEESRNNPETLVKELKAAGKKLPEIYLCCGSEDFLVEPNRQFHQFLTEQGVAHEYHESPGVHDDKFWAEYAPKAVEWFFSR